jgi:hypothetical protein
VQQEMIFRERITILIDRTFERKNKTAERRIEKTRTIG